jgi:CheY-like chemotaxis protein
VTVLNVLLVDDDPESLRLLSQTLPDTVEGATIRWEPCGSFEEALRVIADRRFDIVVADIYRDRKGLAKHPVTGDPQGGGILTQIRERRFCPVLLFTSGVFPPEYTEGPFVKLADKSAPDDQILLKLRELIQTGVPELAHLLHDELDRAAGSYLWQFLEGNWTELEASGLTQPAVLDHLIHRRAGVQLGRLEESGDGLAERPAIEGAEFYLSPPITSEVRLGQVMKRGDEYRVVLTPHCYLIVQPGKTEPRAKFILTALAVPAAPLFAEDPLRGGSEEARAKNLRQRLQSPARFGEPEGRYWFLPGFMGMPDLYADLLQLQSLPAETLQQDWESVAVLDVPFAEALQSCFVRFYSAVGLPVLNTKRFMHLVQTADAQPSHGQ